MTTQQMIAEVKAKAEALSPSDYRTGLLDAYSWVLTQLADARALENIPEFYEEDTRPLWHQVADICTDDALEAKLRAMVERVETEGGGSELMTAVVVALGEARDELKRRRLAHADTPTRQEK